MSPKWTPDLFPPKLLLHSLSHLSTWKLCFPLAQTEMPGLILDLSLSVTHHIQSIFANPIRSIFRVSPESNHCLVHFNYHLGPSFLAGL